MSDTDNIIRILQKHAYDFHKVIPLSENDIVASIDLSHSNPEFTEKIYNDSQKFVAFIDEERKRNNAAYLVGGYREKRDMYRRSNLFDKNISDQAYLKEEPRSLHLGMDIWADAGTKISAPLGGMIHSLAFNNHFGDYGATIILQHQLDTINFYTLYGHLSLKDIETRRSGQFITRGEPFAHFGAWEENGNWPPHLHFQIILDISNYEGDYPGVCKMSEARQYLENCPDPNLILQIQL